MAAVMRCTVRIVERGLVRTLKDGEAHTRLLSMHALPLHARTHAHRGVAYMITRPIFNSRATGRRHVCIATASNNIADSHLLRKNTLKGRSREMHSSHDDVVVGGLSSSGRIDIICGPMFSGKTTALLARVEEAQNRGEKVLLLKSAVDNRYSETTVVSHDGREMDCVALSSLEQLKETFTSVELNEPQLVAIDEAQFFPDLVPFCLEAAEQRQQHVVVAGLDSDFRRAKFGHVLDLICVADSVTKLTSRCTCGAPALFSMRTVADKQTTLIGGAESYMPACRSCYGRVHAATDEDAASVSGLSLSDQDHQPFSRDEQGLGEAQPIA